MLEGFGDLGFRDWGFRVHNEPACMGKALHNVTTLRAGIVQHIIDYSLSFLVLALKP